MILDAFRLDGRVAVVTGAGRGIGAEVAAAFAEVGARVVCAARTRAEIERVAGEIRDRGGEALALPCDVTAAEDVDSLVREAAARLGRIDVLVNNAGGGGHGPTAKITDEQMIEAMRLNFMAPVNLTRAAAPQLRAARGAIVNVSSGFARVANVGSIPYGGAKAALEQATRMLAMELAPEVRVNAIRCGAIETENMRHNLLEAVPGIGPKLVEWTPVRRLGTPRDVALAALYLASDASGYVTGKILDVDGGMVVERSVMEIIARSEALARARARS